MTASSRFNNLLKPIGHLVLIGVSAYVVYLLAGYLFNNLSVTWINIITFVVSMLLMPLSVMMGAKGFVAHGERTFLNSVFFLLLFIYPLIFLVGLIGSISVLHMEFESNQIIAKWLASSTAIHVAIIVAFIACWYVLISFEEAFSDKDI